MIEGYKDDEAIVKGLCAALLGEDEAFTDKLYGLETIEKPKRRELVKMNKDESKKLIDEVREKLEVRSCEVVDKTRQASNLTVRLRINDDKDVEAVVDDLYERDGRLLTRDQLQFRPLGEEEPDEVEDEISS
jgi:hypothetical protein